MKKKYILFSIVTTLLFLSACGGGGGDASFSDGSTSGINLTIDACPIDVPPLNGSSNGSITETLLLGDIIIKNSVPTVITLVINIDGTKNVCVVSGSAHISR